jgi:ATP synthase I chain
MTSEAKTLNSEARIEAANAPDRRAALFVGVTGLVLTVSTTPLYGWQFSRGVFVGALVALVNLWLTARAVRAFVGAALADTPGATTERSGNGASWGLFMVVKFTLLIAGTYLLFRWGWVNGLALIVGLSALPVGVVCLQLAGAPAGANGKR